jgi:cytochrome c553
MIRAAAGPLRPPAALRARANGGTHPVMRISSRFALSFALSISALVAGCGSKSTTEGGSAASGSAAEAPSGPSPTVEARQIFKTVCATCHGEDGTGNTPAGQNLNPHPRNYTDKAWQASVTDEQIKATILGGGAAVGKSPAMPSQPQLKGKPEVLNELVRIIRTFGK